MIDIDEARIAEFTEKRLSDGYERSSVNRSLAYLRFGFRLMFKQHLISRMPTIELLDGENVRQGFVEVGDMDSVLEKVRNPDVRDLVEYLYLSGWRSGEGMNFRWSWIDDHAGMIRLPAEFAKNKKARVMPMTSMIREVLDRRRAKRRLDCAYVFHRDGKPIRYFRDSFKAAAHRAGLDGTLPHDMRRSAVRNFRRAGLSESEGMALSGHRTRSVYDRYNIISESDLYDRMNRVEEHLKAEKHHHKVTPISKRKA